MRLFAIVLLGGLIAGAQDQSWRDKIVGTWKLNGEKSKLPITYSSYTMKADWSAPNTLRTEIDSLTETGDKVHRVLVRVCDGKERQASEMAPGITEICGPSALKIITNRDGKPWAQIEGSFSPDGKVHTLIRKVLGNDGQWTETVSVYERQ